MSLSMRDLLATFFSLTILLVSTVPALAAPGRTQNSAPGPGSRSTIGSHDMCGVEVRVTDNGGFLTGFSPQPDWDFTMAAGLWVGAVTDQGDGNGALASVSTATYTSEFFPPDNPPLPVASPAATADFGPSLVSTLYVDVFTPSFLPDHRPLGIEVTQQSFPVLSRVGVHSVDVKFTIRNISDEWFAPGWTLEDVCLGLMADPDIGRGEELNTWEDDLGGFVSPRDSPSVSIPPGARRGDLAYMYDTPGQGDDVTTQFGAVLRNRRAQVFRIWAGGDSDPQNDLDRYERLRGPADGSPWIDPNPTRSNDYRFLVSVGIVGDLAPGEATSFGVSLVCGALVPVVLPVAERETHEPAGALLRDRVVSRAAGIVRFAGADDAIEIFSVTGRRLARIGSGTGWDFRTEAGGMVPAGVYFWRRAEESAVGGKIVVTR